MSYSDIHGHRSMTFDQNRNAAYLAALQKVITPHSIVLDLGAGLGIHGLLAAKLGAKHVYMVEPQTVLEVAKKVAQANGLADRITFFQGSIEEIALPEKVDVIVSVFTGNFLLEEDLLPSLFYARDNYLKATGVLIPDRAVMEAVPINAPALYEQAVASWSEPHLGLDFSLARPFSANKLHFRRDKLLRQATYLAEPRPLLEMDFHQATNTHCHTETTFSINSNGVCHGWAGWFQIGLGETWLSTAPHAPALHWSAAFLPLDPPLRWTAGENVTLTLDRPPFGDWTWRTRTEQTTQQQSTFLAQTYSPALIRRLAVNHRPQLSQRGQAIAYILARFDGKTAVSTICEDVLTQFPNLGWPKEQIEQIVTNLVLTYDAK